MKVQSYDPTPPMTSSKAQAISIWRKGAVESSRSGSQSSRVIDETSMRHLASFMVTMMTPTDAGFIIKEEVML
jgi:hypothetical protein